MKNTDPSVADEHYIRMRQRVLYWNDFSHLMKYYLRSIAIHSGMRWDSDNDAEIDAMLENLEQYIDL